MLARTIGIRYARDPSRSPFAAVASILRDADVTVGNLECVLGTGGAPAKKAFAFRAPPAAIATLTDAGIDFVTLANNHVLDFGPELLASTTSLLDDAKIAHAGAGMNEADAHRAAVIDVKGIRVAFLGFVHVPTEGAGGFDTKSWDAKGDAPGVAWADTTRIASDVAAAKASADVVVVMLHSGYELSMNANVIQRGLAHAAVDAGAALVIGAHPHVLQGTESYKKGFIAYSLGNFVFDGRDEYSAILRATIDRDGVTGVDWVPVVLRGGFPQPTDAATARWINAVIRQLSLQLGR
jgi:poly-gamma-glutamate synthesis protein (capsule biosynthesis protein)